MKAAKAPLVAYTGFDADAYGKLTAGGHIAEIVQRLWDAMEKIVLPLSAIGVVYGAWMFFSINILGRISTEKQIEQGKAVVKYAIIALAVFYLLPIAFKSAYTAFALSGWEPPSGVT